MPRKPKSFVLDSWAVIAYLEDEPAGEKVADLIADAHEHDFPLLMTVVNVGEVWYTVAREVSEAEAENAVKQLREFGIGFVDADWQLTRDAAKFKAKHRMSYADCFAAALAKREKAELVTGDPEFKHVSTEITLRFLA